MKKQTNEKRIRKINEIITKWGAPFVSLISYGLILGLAFLGIGLMGLSVMTGLFFDAGLLSGFAFLTGGLVFIAGGTITLWKMNRGLEVLCQGLKKPELD